MHPRCRSGSSRWRCGHAALREQRFRLLALANARILVQASEAEQQRPQTQRPFRASASALDLFIRFVRPPRGERLSAIASRIVDWAPRADHPARANPRSSSGPTSAKRSQNTMSSPCDSREHFTVAVAESDRQAACRLHVGDAGVEFIM
jgi:hypothetical protein